MNRTLDYVPRLVEANRAFRVTAADPTLLQRPRYWTPGVVLDQGQEGSCVGHGVVGEWLASPVRGRPVTSGYGSRTRTEALADAGHHMAVGVYDRARQIDEFEGDDTDGTSVRAGMLVARERGWCDGFRWAFSMLELRAALEEGPVVIGVEWREGMYEAPGGLLVPGLSRAVGGHCLLVTGFTPRSARLGDAPAYRLLNSWSKEWGRNGQAYIRSNDLDSILFQSGGEASVVSGRHL